MLVREQVLRLDGYLAATAGRVDHIGGHREAAGMSPEALDDLEAAGRHALAAGAVLADFQPQSDVRVYLDPAGHPFCLFLAG